MRVWWSEDVWGLSTRVCVRKVCVFALVACLESWGDMLYIHGERLAGCVFDKGGGGQVGESAEGIWWSGQ